MTSSDATPARAAEPSLMPLFECPTGRWWACALLGVVFLGMGVFVLFNAVAASIVSAIFFAAALVIGGAFQIVHAFAARGWGGLVLSLVVGVLFVLGGFLLLMNPLATSLGLTLGIAAVLLASGVVRLILAYRHWGEYGWILLASALFGIITGVVLLIGFPWTGLIVPGLLLGIDLLFHGAWWLTLGVFVRRPRGSSMVSPNVAAAR